MQLIAEKPHSQLVSSCNGRVGTSRQKGPKDKGVGINVSPQLHHH